MKTSITRPAWWIFPSAFLFRILLGLFIGNNELVAQDTTASILFYEDFIKQVETGHPIMYRANLRLEDGEANLIEKRGGFDPKLFTDVGQKYYDEKSYYSLVDGGLSIPTWLGLQVKAGYNSNTGDFLNPENSLPESGLIYAGLELPLGQGLFTDERRTELRKAQVYSTLTEMEKLKMRNDLLLEAGKSYWYWYRAYLQFRIYSEALSVAKIRLDAVISGAALGDRPSIDTLEAGIQVQNRQLALQQAELDYMNAVERINLFLWDRGLYPVALEPEVIPQTWDESVAQAIPLINLQDSLLANHPELRMKGLKIDQLELERRWKKEQLKPEVNLKYNALSAPVNAGPIQNYNLANYTWGVQVIFPVFLRKERGALQRNEIKLKTVQLQQQEKQAQLNYKAQISINEWEVTNQQIILYTQTVEDYRRLWEGEKRMFEEGESSLFMVNARELGYIQAQIKRVDLMVKNQNALLKTQYAFAQINREITPVE